VMGKRMFEEGEVGWPADPPFRAPVFVLTHHRRQPWVRGGGGRPSSSSPTGSTPRSSGRGRGPGPGTCGSPAARAPSSSS
jgi:hypothetical protein